MEVYYKNNSPPCTACDRDRENKIFPLSPQFQQMSKNLVCTANMDIAQYAQWHRRMEAMQHAVQSQVYRHLSGF